MADNGTKVREQTDPQPEMPEWDVERMIAGFLRALLDEQADTKGKAE